MQSWGEQRGREPRCCCPRRRSALKATSRCSWTARATPSASTTPLEPGHHRAPPRLPKAGNMAVMSRAQRLLRLVQLLRRYRAPVSAATLAEELQVSVRSIYRDVTALREQGAAIEG